MERNMHNFKESDVVSLKPGGLEMTIDQIGMGNSPN